MLVAEKRSIRRNRYSNFRAVGMSYFRYTARWGVPRAQNHSQAPTHCSHERRNNVSVNSGLPLSDGRWQGIIVSAESGLRISVQPLKLSAAQVPVRGSARERHEFSPVIAFPIFLCYTAYCFGELSLKWQYFVVGSWKTAASGACASRNQITLVPPVEMFPKRGICGSDAISGI